MAENSSDFMKDISLQTQETQCTVRRINTQRS